MNAIVVLVASQPQIVEPLIDSVRPLFADIAEQLPLGFGIGEFGPDGQAVLARRPILQPPIHPDFAQLKQSKTGGIALVQARSIATRSYSPDETLPLKHKKWLWAMADDLDAKADPEAPPPAIPEFLLNQRRSSLPAEEAFLQFLAFVADRRIIEPAGTTATDMQRCLRDALSLLHIRNSPRPGQPLSYIAAAAHAHAVAVFSLGRALWMRTVGDPPDSALDERLRVPLGHRVKRGVVLSTVDPRNHSWQVLEAPVQLLVDSLGRYRVTVPAAPKATPEIN